MLTALERSPKPMTMCELNGDIDDAFVLSSLLEAGYVGRHDDGRYGLSCDTAKLSLFELNELFRPYKCGEESVFFDIFEESLREMTIACIMEIARPKPASSRDIEMFQDCIRRIEQRTGDRFPVWEVKEAVEDVAERVLT